MVRKATVEYRDNNKNVIGKAETHHILLPDEKHENIRMYAKVVLKPQSEIVFHQHVGETEPYYVLSGKGIFTDNDKTKTEISAGDVCLIENMQFHGIENTSKDEDLVFMALIYQVRD